MRVIWTEQALRELEAIGDYTARGSGQRASNDRTSIEKKKGRRSDAAARCIWGCCYGGA
jgi:plasmid stabilization system protein ParE